MRNSSRCRGGKNIKRGLRKKNVKEKGRRREGQREIEVKKVKRGKIKGLQLHTSTGPYFYEL
jgi:hypothetical protein